MDSVINTLHGYGYGYGEGGYGDGYGDGSGYGHGDGTLVGHVGDYEVCVLIPWKYVEIGCESLCLSDWRRVWRSKMQEHEITGISDAEVQQLFAKVEAELSKSDVAVRD